MAYILENFYKSTITLDWTIGTGNFYVETKPVPNRGFLVVSPNNTAIKEIVKYTATGTDANGDYITISERGVGGTVEQTHSQGEPVRMNITAEYWADMQNDINTIVAAGVANATTTSMGGVEIATAAEIDAGTATGSSGAPIVITPDNVNAAHNIPFVAPGTSGNTMISNGTDWVSSAFPSKYSYGTVSKNITDASTTQVIPHGMGVLPKKVRLSVNYCHGSGNPIVISNGTSDGTNNSCIYMIFSTTSIVKAGASSTYSIALSDDASSTIATRSQTGTVTFDATNINIIWTKNGSPATGTFSILWEAQY